VVVPKGCNPEFLRVDVQRQIQAANMAPISLSGLWTVFKRGVTDRALTRRTAPRHTGQTVVTNSAVRGQIRCFVEGIITVRSIEKLEIVFALEFPQPGT